MDDNQTTDMHAAEHHLLDDVGEIKDRPERGPEAEANAEEFERRGREKALAQFRLLCDQKQIGGD